MALPTYADPLEKIWHYFYLVLCAAIFLFLIAPILIVMPLSFNAEPYFTFTEKKCCPSIPTGIRCAGIKTC